MGGILKITQFQLPWPWAETPSSKTSMLKELRHCDRLYLYSSQTSLVKGNHLKAKWQKNSIIPRWQPKSAFCSLLTTWLHQGRLGMVLTCISFYEYLPFLVIYINLSLVYSNDFLFTTECYLCKDTGDILVLGNLENISFRKLWELFHNLMWYHALDFCIIVKFQPQFALIFQKMDYSLKSIFGQLEMQFKQLCCDYLINLR